MDQDSVFERGILTVVRARPLAGIPYFESDVRDSVFRRQLSGRRYPVLVKVDADHQPRPDGFREAEGDVAQPAATVKQRVARFEVGQQKASLDSGAAARV